MQMIEEDGKVPTYMVANVDARLRELGKNRAWLSVQMGITPSLMGRIMNRRAGVKLQTLQRMVNQLGWDVADLFAREGQGAGANMDVRTKDDFLLWLTSMHGQTMRLFQQLWEQQATGGVTQLSRAELDEIGAYVAKRRISEQQPEKVQSTPLGAPSGARANSDSGKRARASVVTGRKSG